MQSAHLRVEIAQASGQARYVAHSLERAFRAVNGIGQCALEADKSAGNRALGGELEQRMSRRLDLLRAVEFGIGAERVVDHSLADVDQLTTQPRIMDRSAVFAGIDDADHRGEKLREIGGA